VAIEEQEQTKVKAATAAKPSAWVGFCLILASAVRALPPRLGSYRRGVIATGASSPHSSFIAAVTKTTTPVIIPPSLMVTR
jgi:hypothetical protein